MKKEVFEYINLKVIVFRDDERDTCALIMFGSMETDSVIEFRTQIREQLLLHRYNYIVDLQNVTYLSSTGLGLLMFLAAHKKNTVHISTPSKSIAKPLKILGIHPMFKFFNSYEELAKDPAIPATMIDNITQLFDEKQDIEYQDRWLKILRDYLIHEQIIEELNIMMPFIKQAEQNKKISIPSDKKYTCIVYYFFEHIFRNVAQFDKQEIDDDTIELIAKELMQNAVIHGYGQNKKGTIDIQYATDSSRLTIDFIDYGKGVQNDIEHLFPPAGLDLIRKVFDDLKISNAPKNEDSGLVLGKGTRVTLTKSLLPRT